MFKGRAKNGPTRNGLSNWYHLYRLWCLHQSAIERLPSSGYLVDNYGGPYGLWVPDRVDYNSKVPTVWVFPTINDGRAEWACIHSASYEAKIAARHIGSFLSGLELIFGRRLFLEFELDGEK